MTGPEWVVLVILAVRASLAPRPGGGLLPEALADAPMLLPCLLLQEARVFHPDGWTVHVPGAVLLLSALSSVALLGVSVTLAGRIAGRLDHLLAVRGRIGLAQPWRLAAVDLLVLAGMTAAFESLMLHTGGWTYRLIGPFGNIPAVGIPWVAVIGAGGFGLFFAQTIRQYRRWTADALGGLAVRCRALVGPALAEPQPLRPWGAGLGPGLRRTVGTAVLRFLDL